MKDLLFQFRVVVETVILQNKSKNFFGKCVPYMQHDYYFDLFRGSIVSLYFVIAVVYFQKRAK